MTVVPTAQAQTTRGPDDLQVDARLARTWSTLSESVVVLDGPVVIRADQINLYADRAVIWFTPAPAAAQETQVAEIALLGDAKIEQPGSVRTGPRLMVSLPIRGAIRVSAEQRLAVDASGSDTYEQAAAMRMMRVEPQPAQRPAPALLPSDRADQAPARPPPAPPPGTVPSGPVNFQARDIETRVGADGKVMALLSGGVVLLQTRGNGDFVELQADRAVLFTPLENLAALEQADRIRQVQQAVKSAYLEGDVRISFTPADPTQLADQRLQAERVYYDFETDQAVLTDAVLHTYDLQRQIPIVLRAQTVKQLALGEYQAERVELTTSTFAVPSYSVRATKAYVRQYDTGDPRLGRRTVFQARNTTFNAFGLPVFYLPGVAGSMTDRGAPLRDLQFGGGDGFGPSVRTRWGLFETLGRLPPDGLDASYRLDYYGDRGPAAGLDLDYSGARVTEATGQPWNFEGQFNSYIVADHGEDRLGRDRRRIEPEDNLRYRVQWQHQHFFPEDWQAQLRAGAVSDPTFLEEWYENIFDTGLPTDVSAYLKRQRQTEAITALLQFQPSDLVTTSEMLQESFEVEKLPELGYRRIGDSIADDQLTFFSDNTLAALRFNRSRAELDGDLGFRVRRDPGTGDIDRDSRFVGLPSLGQTGAPEDVTYRGDFRQQFDWPIYGENWNIVPFLVARYTGYSDSPEDNHQHRFLIGAGARASTTFWKTYDNARSALLDITRIRHVVQPEMQLFTSVATEDRDDVFIYEESVDAVSDISAIQLAIRQRWQTKRGAPGLLRSVDVFALNVEANFFFNQPDELSEFILDDPSRPIRVDGFRGLYFYSQPEASLSRSSINADAFWRVSDTTVVLSDVQWNLDQFTLATSSIGLAVRRDPRLSYFAGLRYIGVVNSTIATLAADYQFTRKYSFSIAQAFDLSENGRNSTNFTITRKFDRFFVTFTLYYDYLEDAGGVRLGIFPEGLGYGATTEQFQSAFGSR